MKAFLTIILFLTGSFVQAQSMEEIRKAYEEVNKNIEESTKDPAYGPYYYNELTVNTGEKSWRAVGNYKKTVKFWYTDEPSHNTEGDAGPNGVGVLKKVSITENSTYTQNLEYLFNQKGQLIFFYFSYQYNSGENSNKQEYRFYFSNNKLIKFLPTVPASTTDKIYKESDWPKVLKEAKKYQQIFLSSFQ